MRLPEFLTELSPIQETLEALEQGEAALARAVAEKNAQVCVATADEGLALWEADWGLPVREGAPLEDRRSAVRAAMAGGRTLTPALLRELCVTLGGADRGEVEEDFPNWHVTSSAVGRDRFPEDTALRTNTVSHAKALRLLLDCEGVADVAGFTMNGSGSSLTLAEGAAPVAGTVALTEVSA